MSTMMAESSDAGPELAAAAADTGRAPRRGNNFDLIRLVAALQVVISHGSDYLHVHLPDALMQVLSFMPGVPIFFVVSGFLISLSWERSKSAAQYARNRVLRIYPALWTCLLVSIAIFLAAGVRPDSLATFVAWIFAQATIVQFFNPAFLRSFGIGVLNGSLWTIPVELQFYVVVPLLARLAQRRTSRWLALTAGAAIVMFLARLALGDGSTPMQKLLSVSILPYLFYFLVGVVARYAYDARPRLFEGRMLFWLGAYVAWVVAEIQFAIPAANGNNLNIVSVLLLAGTTVSAAFTARSISARVVRGNDISYGLYIYHAPLMNLLIAMQLGGAHRFALFMALSVGAAVLSWTFVEKPALSLKHQTIRSV